MSLMGHMGQTTPVREAKGEAPPGFGARTTTSDCFVIGRGEIVVAVHGIRANRYLASSQRPSFFARSI